MKIANFTTVYRSTLIEKAYKQWAKNGQKVLDIGCGTGIIAHELSERLDLRITGCDIDKYTFVDLPFKKMKQIDKLPFKKKEFDVAMFNDVLHHTNYKNQNTLLRESLRVAKYVLIFELRPTFISRYGDFLINKIHHPQMDIPYTYRKEEEWEHVFNNLNVKIDKVIIKRPFFYPFSHVAYKLSKSNKFNSLRSKPNHTKKK
jgi:ubiquinone/menaquinone biosynthesis C-methylase UbiE